MKTIFKEYGGMIVAAVVATAVIVLLMNSINLMALLGEKSDIKGVSYAHAVDLAATDKILTSKKPQIRLKQFQRLKSGENYDLEAAFEVVAEGEVSLKILEILDADGNDITENYPVTAYYFPVRGIYSITVQAEKTDGVKAEKQFFLPVQ